MVILSLVLYAGHRLNSDEGVVLNAAWQLWHGKVMYRDFIENVTPGSAYAIYLIWKLAGAPTYLAAKLFSIALFLASCFGLWQLAKRATKKNAAAALSVMLWVYANIFYPLINHNPYSSYAAIWFVYSLTVALEHDQRWRYFLTGVLGAIVFLVLQTKGLTLAATTIVLTLWLSTGPAYRRFSRVLAFSLGLVIPVALAVWRFGAAASWRAWIASPHNLYWQVNAAAGSPLILVIIIAASVVLLDWATHQHSAALRVLALTQVALWLSSAQLLDWPHVLINAFPLAILITVGIDHALRTTVNKRIRVLLLVDTTVIGIVMALHLSLVAVANIIGPSIYSSDLARQSWQGVAAAPEVRQARFIYAGPLLPGLYFELKKPNPFRYSNTLTCDEACWHDTVQTLATVKPEVTLLDYTMVQKYNYRTDNIVDQYIERHYQPCHLIDQLPLSAAICRKRVSSAD